MEKCDVCNKTTLLPEKLGKAIICKKCLIKIDGLMWKYHNFEKMENSEKFRQKALVLATKNQYPSIVIEGINEFFDAQQGEMKKCEACNEVKLSTIQLGEATICKKCFSKITKNWDNESYFDRSELYQERDETIKFAKSKNFPKAALEYIKEYFEAKVSKDWICTLDGRKEQVIELYDDYLTIKTSSNFDEREMEKNFKALANNGHLSNEELKSLKMMGKELLGDILPFGLSHISKGVVSTIGSATNKISEVFGNSKNESLSKFVKTGKRKISYSSCENIRILLNGDVDVGALIIISKNEKSNDYLFFFERHYENKMKQIKKIISEKLIEKENKKQTKQESKNNEVSVANQIRELKELLDEGLITQEEFDAKKRQLLGI